MVEGAERRLFAKGGARELQFADTPILKFCNLRTEAIVRMNARVDTRMSRWRA
jgi:hypothetical protein